MDQHRKLVILCTSVFVIPALVCAGIAAQKGDKEVRGDEKRPIDDIVRYLKQEGVGLSDEKLMALAGHVYQESLVNEVDYRLVLAVMKIESNFKGEAVSSKGARGLLQVKPSLAKDICKDAGVQWTGNDTLHEPDKNIKLGVYHLGQLIEDFGNIAHALYAYNTGSTRAKANISNNKNRPTPRFARMVMQEYERNASVLPHPEPKLTVIGYR
jgi:soluble lytic murein transglycosylase